MSSIIVSSMETVNPDTTTRVLTTIQIFYGVPSLILMIFFIAFLGLSKNYENSFYRLVQFSLLVNIAVFMNSWLALRLEKFPNCIGFLKFLETIVPGSLSFFKYLTNCFLHLQFISTAVMSIHRITAILFPQKYDKIWSRLMPLFYILSFGYLFLPNLLFIRNFTVTVDIVNGTLTKTRYFDRMIAGSNVATVFSVVYFVLITIFGLSTSVLVSRKMSGANSSTEKISKKLTRTALTYCFLYTGILCWTVLTTVNSYYPFIPEFLNSINTTLLTFASDLMTLALPYILLVQDGNVRKDLFRGSRPRGAVSNSMIVTNLSSR